MRPIFRSYRVLIFSPACTFRCLNAVLIQITSYTEYFIFGFRLDSTWTFHILYV